MVRKARSKKRRAGRIGKVKLKTSAYAKFKPPNFQDMVVKTKWDPTKTARVNLANMGLRCNVNESISKRNVGTTPPSNIDCNSPFMRNRLANLDAANSNNESRNDDSNNNNNDKVAVELFDVPDSDPFFLCRTNRRTKSDVMLPMSIEEQEYVARCMGRHGIDYVSMARDIRTNDMQHTECKLRKLGSRFLLLESRHRRVDVPEKVKQYLPGGGGGGGDVGGGAIGSP